jgi:hypothetical protein
MRVWVYVPTGETTANPNITVSAKTEVDVESLDPLFDKLTAEAPQGTRVVSFTPTGSRHYVLGRHGFERKLEVIAS